MRFNAFFLSFWIYFLGVLLLPFFFSFSPDLQRRGKKRFSLLSPLSLALCVPKAICLSHLFFSPLLFFLLLENYLDRERGGGRRGEEEATFSSCLPPSTLCPFFGGGEGRKRGLQHSFFLWDANLPSISPSSPSPVKNIGYFKGAYRSNNIF